MSSSHGVIGRTLAPILVVFSVPVGLSLAQTYHLGNDVLEGGGTKMVSSSCIVGGSFGQPTIGRMEGANYRAIIGFWHPPYAPPPGVEERLLVPSPAPTVFSLSQNYPNPLSHITTIRYSVPGRRGAGVQRGDLPAYQHINLSVYDVCGRMVRTLLDTKQEPGYYSVTWDLRGASGERLPNGVYFYRIKAQGFVQTRKMVILK